MKKKIILILAIIIIIAGFYIVRTNKQSKFNYEIEKITEYNYFIYKICIRQTLYMIIYKLFIIFFLIFHRSTYLSNKDGYCLSFIGYL